MISHISKSILLCFCYIDQASFNHKDLTESWWLTQRGHHGRAWGSPAPSTFWWRGRTPGFHPSRNRHCRLYIFSCKMWIIFFSLVISYLSSGSCYQCWPHGDQREKREAVLHKPRLILSLPRAQLRLYHLQWRERSIFVIISVLSLRSP